MLWVLGDLNERDFNQRFTVYRTIREIKFSNEVGLDNLATDDCG